MATNGYFANGFGGGAKGMAGAGVAVSAGVLGLAQNPAMGVRIGNSAGMCLTTFAPNRGFTVGAGGGGLTPGDYESNNLLFPIPCGGVNFSLGEDAALGFYVTANGGMNTEYDANPFDALIPGGPPPGDRTLGVSLEQMFISTNYARKFSNGLTFGVAPVLALQRFKAKGLDAFAGFSADPAHVTGQDWDWSSGVGLNLGVLYEPGGAWTFGASYRSRINMSEFDDYAGLFAEQGDFDIPAMATIGAAWTPAAQPRLTFTGEVQRIYYGDVASISNSGALLATPLGADNGPGFGWDDMTVVRLAAIHQTSARLTLRGGISYATDFTEDNEVLFNVLAPATIQWHLSVGASYKVTDNWGITGSYTRALHAAKAGANLSPGLGNPVRIEMDQHEFAIGATYKW